MRAIQNIKINKSKKNWTLFYMAFPLVLLVILFQYVPLFGWILSLFEYKPGYPIFANKFVGLKYFEMIFSSKSTLRVLKNTLIFSAVGFIMLPIPMILAILLNEIRSKSFKKLAQTVTTLPHFISWIIVYSIAFGIFSTEGMLNQLFNMLNMDAQSILTSKKDVYWFQPLVGLWKEAGWGAIIYVAAITGIDPELYEAATVDGANRFRCVLSITIPSLMPTFVVMMLLKISNLMNTGMDQYYVFKNNFVYNNIEVIDLYVYRLGLQQFDYSYATAAGILKSVISITLLFISNTVAKRVRGQSIV